MCDDNYFKYKSRSVPTLYIGDVEAIVSLYKQFIFDYFFPSMDGEWVAIKVIDLGIFQVKWSWNIKNDHLQIYVGDDPRINPYASKIKLLSHDGWPDDVHTVMDMFELSKRLVSRYMFKDGEDA